MARDQKITLGQMRNPDGGRGGTRHLLVCCADYKCGHMVRLASAEVDQWPDDLRLSDLEPKFTCRKCGRRGADVRPDFD
ncbi:hypothetical protein IVA98_13660 [Bradyrhizobium sp. 160]|uniref:hypothetical protein n=1 Tax=unclassified Bradyrhizobium TaxID=2631580 RepID=UPI001FFA9BC0|nr:MULTISPECIES: hypothetical protein [unclassified Bradyrhizobium]MCK1543969.1 hypothetical protein [Bradyrhizobium sp. 179]MCK1624190.1 hypothetical protein [Bradyrhizobium sp. 160]